MMRSLSILIPVLAAPLFMATFCSQQGKVHCRDNQGRYTAFASKGIEVAYYNGRICDSIIPSHDWHGDMVQTIHRGGWKAIETQVDQRLILKLDPGVDVDNIEIFEDTTILIQQHSSDRWLFTKVKPTGEVIFKNAHSVQPLNNYLYAARWEDHLGHRDSLIHVFQAEGHALLHEAKSCNTDITRGGFILEKQEHLFLIDSIGKPLIEICRRSDSHDKCPENAVHFSGDSIVWIDTEQLIMAFARVYEQYDRTLLGLYDLEHRDTLRTPQFDLVSPPNEGMIAVRCGIPIAEAKNMHPTNEKAPWLNGWGYLDTKGYLVLYPGSDVEHAGSFSEGKAVLSMRSGSKKQIDTLGREI